MRKALCGGLLGAVSALAALTPTATADTPWSPDGAPTGASETLPAPDYCSFPMTITVISKLTRKSSKQSPSGRPRRPEPRRPTSAASSPSALPTRTRAPP